MRRLIIALATAVVSSLACKVGPDYVRPSFTAAPPTSYKEAGDWKVAQPNDELQRGAWWQVFGEPSLDSLARELEISNQNLKAAEAQYRAALAAIRVARAGLFPTITLGAAVDRAHRLASSDAVSERPVPTNGDITVYSLPADLSWEADIWGRIRRTVEGSEGSAQASAADLESALLSAQASLAQSYLQLQTLDAQRKVLAAAVMAFERSLEVAKNRYASGVVARTDVLQAESQLESTRAQALDLGVQRAQLEHAIAVLIGKPASSFSLPPTPLSAAPPVIPIYLPSELLERRPDVAAAERRMAAANAQIGVATAAWFPQVDLSGSAGFLASSLASWLSWPSLFWSVGATLSQTAFEGGLRSAQTDQARAAYDAAVAFYRQTALGAFQDVEDNLAALRILEEEARVQDKALEAARQVEEITTNQYQAGTVSYLEVLVAQTTALNNERAAIDVRGRRMSATVLLIKALGGGWKQGPAAATRQALRIP